MIELRVLGPLDLWSANPIGAAHVLSQPKRLALLTYLASAIPSGFHRRDTLVALFWPELDDTHARAALRNSLSFLRRELGDATVLVRAGEVAVNHAELRCDSSGFDTALNDGQPEEALTLYRGDFLKGFHVSASNEFDAWVETERGRRRRLAREAAW